VNVTALLCCILDVISKYRSCLFSVGSGAPYRATRRTGRVSRGHAVTLSVVLGQLGQRQRRGRTPLIVLDAWISPARLGRRSFAYEYEKHIPDSN